LFINRKRLNTEVYSTSEDKTEIREMCEEWAKPEDVRDYSKLLLLLKSTYDCRRKSMHTTLAKTSALRKEYPALFFRDAILQEFQMITVSDAANSFKLAQDRAIRMCPRFVDIARSGSDMSKQKRMKVEKVLVSLEMSLEETTDVDKQQLIKATAGLIILPILLGENSAYFFNDFQVSIHTLSVILCIFN